MIKKAYILLFLFLLQSSLFAQDKLTVRPVGRILLDGGFFESNQEGLNNGIGIPDFRIGAMATFGKFTAYIDVDATVNAIEEDVTLYRPFAQLNLGVDNTEWTDAVNAGVTVSKSKIVVTNVYNQFSAYDNAVVVTAEPVTMTFAMNTIPTEELEVDVDRDGTIANTEKFKYLALNYLLVGDAGTEKSLTDVEFVWENSDASKTNNPTTSGR